MSDIRQFVERIMAGTKEAPQGRYHPTLVVGLGGTGLRVLRNLKKRLVESNVNQVRLFGIDSDNSENEKNPELPPLSNSEMAILNQEVAVLSLERAAAGHDSDAHILDFLPNEHAQFKGLHQEVKGKITSQKGAGQFRRAGKLLFCANVKGGANLNARVQELRNQLTGLATAVAQVGQGLAIEPGVCIYVVGSIAGGTGAGSVLDCLALLRMHFNSAHDVITGIFVLPGELFDQICMNPQLEQKQTRGNAIAVLRELQPFIVGSMGNHTFKFDQHTTLQLGDSSLVNDVYLVDHRTFDGRLAKGDKDLYRAVSQFLYALVGSGVGASLAAGRINGHVTIDHKNQPVPLVYSAFGVGGIEYPFDSLLEYSVRASLGQWFNGWLSQKPDVAKMRDDVDNFVTGLNLRDLETLRERLLPDVEDSRLSSEWKRTVLRESDSQFLERSRRRRENLTVELQKLQSVIEQRATAFTAESGAKLEAKLLEAVCQSRAGADTIITQVRQHLEGLAESRRKESEKRQANLASLQTKLEKKERWINILDFGDGGLRKQYLKLTEEAMLLNVADQLEPHIAQVLTRLTGRLAELETKLGNLNNELASFNADNSNTLKEIEVAPFDSCFVQTALPSAAFPKWVAAHAIPIPAFAAPASFTMEELLEAALTPVIPNYRRLIQGLDLCAIAGTDKDLNNAVLATNVASEPLIYLIQTAPSREELVPQKFAAGPFATDRDPFIHAHFTQVGPREVAGLPTDDPHRIICAQTVTGYGAPHWRGFTVAAQYYREQEWRYHALPDCETLPWLEPMEAGKEIALRNFGLGLAFELVTCRGANFYWNFAYHGPEDLYYYLLYKADPNGAAKRLLDVRPELVKMAGASQTRPKKEYLMGGKLEDAFAQFQLPLSATFVHDLTELVDSFIANIGKASMSTVVRAYADNELDSLIAKAVPGSARLRILEEIKKALQTYAAELV